jgi:4-amino-4-deoxy-L-arabinose transferase-like glycosyltransferase
MLSPSAPPAGARPAAPGPAPVAPDLGTLGRDPAPRRQPFLLGGILLAAVALRAYGLWWGLPGRTDLNPDESTVRQLIDGMSWQNLDPGRYFYGAFFYVVCVLVRSLLRLAYQDIGEYALVVAYRGVSVLFGTATVAMLYVLLRRVAPSGPAPLLGAAFLAVLPLHVWDSHFAVTDVTLTFWMTATVTAAVWAYEHPSWGRFTLASALVGVAIGTKFNGAFATVAIALAGLAAVWERRLRVRQLLTWGALGVAAALLALFVASPHMFLQWQENWKAFQHEMHRVWVPNYGFGLWAPGWQYKPYVYQFAAAFPFSFGVALYAAMLGGLVYCARRWRPVLVVPFGYAAFYLAVMGSWDFVPIRYYLPFEPALLMAPALALAAGLTAPAPRVRWASAAALAAVLAYTLAFTVSTTARFADDTRLQAERWLQKYASAGSSILTVGASWYLPKPTGPRVTNLVQFGAMPNVVNHRLPDFVVLTSLQYARSYREQDGNVAGWDTIRRGQLPYSLVRRFQARYLHWRFYSWLDPMFEGYFVSPTIEVYRRAD